MRLQAGEFYHFRRQRIISRPGALIREEFGLEIGPAISESRALAEVRANRDVYTLMKQDAKALARKADPSGRAKYHPPHDPRNERRATVTRDDLFYQHYHPADDHDTMGHVFFGARGERYAARDSD
jgi:hypothetical protein